jgi:ketosteroid isomerase-like protein
MDSSQIEAHVRGVYSAFAAGDEPAYRAGLAEDIVWHVPGDNPVSGPYRGHAEYFETMTGRMAPLDDWRVEVREVLTNERDRAALVVFRVTGLRRGRSVDLDGFHMVRLDEDGRICEGWGFTRDQAALDAFFSA